MKNKAINLAQGVWNAAPGSMSAAYLVTGNDKALLIDSGAGDTDIMETLRRVTDLPVTVVVTHHHSDHLGGLKGFEAIYAHPKDIPSIIKEHPAVSNFLNPVKEGDKFDLGGRTLEVLDIPGHSPGSIALLDRSNRIIFTGDTVSDGPVFIIDGDSDIEKYIASLDRLLSMREDIDKIFCCHGTSVQDISAVEKLKSAALEYAGGKLKPELRESPMKAELYINAEGVGFIRPVNK